METNWSVDAQKMRACSCTQAKVILREISRRNVEGCHVRREQRRRWQCREVGTSAAGGAARRGGLRQLRATAPLAERARISGPALHRPLCETVVGYARRAAANSRPLAHRRKEKWNAPQWCGRARRLCTPRGLQ